jgi:GT2 family glycosyltransferase
MTVHNCVELTLARLRSLRAQNTLGATLDVYVVDDASTDGTADRVSAEHPEVVLLRGNGDLFWNGGTRVALGAALRRDYGSLSVDE